jgi:iron complex transport system substrate-binding protein
MTARFLIILTLLGAFGCRQPERPGPLQPSGPRFVSLAPNLTEMMFAVGAGSNLIGRTSVCDYPAAAAAVPVVGGYGDPSFEMLLALHPDHILYVDMLNKDFSARLKERGLDARLVPCLHLDDIPAALAEVGRLAGRPERGDELAASLRSAIETARAAVSNAPRPRVFVAIWDDPLYTVGRGSFVSELVALAGGLNIGDEVDSPYFAASPEWVISRNPEIILCLFMDESRQTVRRIASIPAFATLDAIRNRRIYADFNLSELLRPGPRVMNSVAALRRCFHPPSPQEKP